MTPTKNNLVNSETSSAEDAQAIKYFKDSIAAGKHWYLALLGSIGIWSSPSEIYNERSFCYLIDGEAFDWLLLAERLCNTMDTLVPEGERDALLFNGIPPIQLNAAEVKQLIGEKKYAQYLNYFYGITVEEAILLAVQEEIDKERGAVGLRHKDDYSDEPYLRVYGIPREELYERFRQEKGLARRRSITIAGLKEFTYWSFKYRLKQSEKARIASDTKKALDYLKHQWQKKGVSWVLATDPSANGTA